MDTKTLNNITSAFEALNKYNKWLIKRKDPEAVKKLMPTVEKMRNLMVGALRATGWKPSRIAEKFKH